MISVSALPPPPSACASVRTYPASIFVCACLPPQPSACGGGLAHCCAVDCGGYGGDRLCGGSGGLRLRVCHDNRARACRPVALLPAEARFRYYVTTQPQWAKVTAMGQMRVDGSGD